jgi:hypothetical protein
MSGTPKTVAFAGTEPSSYIETKTQTLETLSPLDSLSNQPTPQWSIPRSGQSSRGRYGSEFTKSAMARMAGDNPGDECWMCNIDRSIQHCHVIGIADRQVWNSRCKLYPAGNILILARLVQEMDCR